MRTFCIGKCEYDLPECPLVTVESDTLGILGELLILISQLDPGEAVMISCTGDE